MAEKACHVVASTTQVGLIRTLGAHESRQLFAIQVFIALGAVAASVFRSAFRTRGGGVV